MSYSDSRYKTVHAESLGQVDFTTSTDSVQYWRVPCTGKITDVHATIDTAFTTKLATTATTSGAYAQITIGGTVADYLANTTTTAGQTFSAALTDTNVSAGDSVKVEVPAGKVDTSGKAWITVDFMERYA